LSCTGPTIKFATTRRGDTNQLLATDSADANFITQVCSVCRRGPESSMRPTGQPASTCKEGTYLLSGTDSNTGNIITKISSWVRRGSVSSSASWHDSVSSRRGSVSSTRPTSEIAELAITCRKGIGQLGDTCSATGNFVTETSSVNRRGYEQHEADQKLASTCRSFVTKICTVSKRASARNTDAVP
jgi:hypothetical protein